MDDTDRPSEEIDDLAWKLHIAWQAHKTRQTIQWTERRIGSRPAGTKEGWRELAEAMLEAEDEARSVGLASLGARLREGALLARGDEEDARAAREVFKVDGEEDDEGSE